MEQVTSCQFIADRPFQGLCTFGTSTTPEFFSTYVAGSAGTQLVPWRCLVGYDRLNARPTGEVFVIVSGTQEGHQNLSVLWLKSSFLRLRDEKPYAPWAEHIAKLREDIGLPVGAVAETLMVSRQAYYDWQHGELPNPSNQERIATLMKIAAEWRSLQLGPLSRYWKLPSRRRQLSMRDCLTASDLSLEAFKDCLRALGLGPRLLPPRSSRPRLVEKSKQRRSWSQRAWTSEAGESE